MVSYQKLTSIGYDVAKQKGAEFAGISSGQEVIGVVSECWNEDTEKLKQMTEQQARQYMEESIHISRNR